MMGNPAEGSAAAVKSAGRRGTKVKKKSTFREYAEAIVIAVALTLVIRTFVIQAFRIPTGSMEDTLLVGDFLFVNKFLYGAGIPFTDTHLPGLREPQRGDILVFKFPKDTSRDFIKRVVGEPGDVIEIRNKVLHINGEPRDEPFVKFTNPHVRPESYPNPHIYPSGAGNRDNRLRPP